MTSPNKEPYRSKFEQEICNRTRLHGGSFLYEPFRLRFSYPARLATYLPDMVLDNGIVVEIKGHFRAEDRAKFVAISQMPTRPDIRFVFQRAQNRCTGREMTYAQFAEKHGFLWADGYVPIAWIAEDYCPRRWEILAEMKVTS